MQYVNKKGLDISVFSLGTVQLGMDYGLGDNTQKPSKEFAFSVLDRAAEQGVTVFDTANNYGDSEKIIGEWLQQTDKKPFVITKIGPFEASSDEALRQEIIAQAEKSREDLGVPIIDMLMLHYFSDYEKNPKIVQETFAYLKEKGVYRYSGISAYSHENYHNIAKSGFDAVQIPLNVFDWTQIKNGGIQALSDAGMMIFARSVFLQGLVFFKPDEVESRIDFCVPYLEKLLALCEEFDMEAPVLALSYVLSVPGVASVTLGCQTPEQIDANCKMIDQVRKLTPEMIEKLREAFIDTEQRVIFPSMWPKK